MAFVALAIIAATGVGVGSERRWGERALALSRRLIDLIVWVLMPFVAFFVVADLHLGGGVGAGLLFGYGALATVGLLAYVIGTHVLRLPRPAVGSLICVVILANTGYLGIPLNAALLGHDALAPAIAWDTLISNVVLYTAGFGVGAAFGTEAGEGARERLRAFLTRIDAEQEEADGQQRERDGFGEVDQHRRRQHVGSQQTRDDRVEHRV